MRNRLRVEVRASVAEKMRPLLPRFRRLLARAARAGGIEGREVSILFTDDKEMRQINRQFANEDHATDVLSFAQIDFGTLGRVPSPPRRLRRAQPGSANANEGATPRRGKQPRPLGDIVLALPTAARQAREKGHSLLAELFHLSVHGLVHLLGYDHADKASERVMFGYEAELRRRARSAQSLEPARRPRR
jgi:probable rRNA maturation factor